jgi:hypothetical protein
MADPLDLIMTLIPWLITAGIGYLLSNAFTKAKWGKMKPVIKELADTVEDAGVALKDFSDAMADDKISEEEAAKLLLDLKEVMAEVASLKNAVILLITPEVEEKK